jgi:hypothetical protein
MLIASAFCGYAFLGVADTPFPLNGKEFSNEPN